MREGTKSYNGFTSVLKDEVRERVSMIKIAKWTCQELYTSKQQLKRFEDHFASPNMGENHFLNLLD